MEKRKGNTSRRVLRVAGRIKFLISQVIQRELNDPRIGMITVLGVEPTEDLKEAKIYVSVLGTPGDASKARHALEDARGFIQKEVGKNLETRNTPVLKFLFEDPTEKKVARIEALIEEASQEDREAKMRDDAPKHPAANPSADSSRGKAEPPPMQKDEGRKRNQGGSPEDRRGQDPDQGSSAAPQAHSVRPEAGAAPAPGPDAARDSLATGLVTLPSEAHESACSSWTAAAVLEAAENTAGRAPCASAPSDGQGASWPRADEEEFEDDLEDDYEDDDDDDEDFLEGEDEDDDDDEDDEDYEDFDEDDDIDEDFGSDDDFDFEEDEEDDEDDEDDEDFLEGEDDDDEEEDDDDV